MDSSMQQQQQHSSSAMETEEECHIVNPHIQFGAVNWSQLSPAEQEKVVHERVTYRPTGPTTGSFSTPPASPAAARVLPVPMMMMANPTPPSDLASSTGFAGYKTAGAPMMRSSPYAAQIRAELAAQQQQGKVVNAHLSFVPHAPPPAPGAAASSSTNQGINMGRLGLRAMHQEGQQYGP